MPVRPDKTGAIKGNGKVDFLEELEKREKVLEK
jgi:hypothetical protein